MDFCDKPTNSRLRKLKLLRLLIFLKQLRLHLIKLEEICNITIYQSNGTKLKLIFKK